MVRVGKEPMADDNTQGQPNDGQVAYPPAPWRLRGAAVCLFQTVEIGRARDLVPPEVSIFPIFPGKTLGGLYLARYREGSALTYNELIVIPALIWRRGRIGAWVSHIYVDDTASVAGGREIWGLPKERAAFERAGNEEITVHKESAALCTLRLMRPRRTVPLPVVLPAFGHREEFLWFRASGRADVGLLRAEAIVPPDSPFAFWRSGRGVGIDLQNLDIAVHPPTHFGG